MSKYCTGCKLKDMGDMAQIPYIEHEARMFKAYQREKRWMMLFIISNCLWIVGAILSLVR
jgi:hypothetical protein